MKKVIPVFLLIAAGFLLCGILAAEAETVVPDGEKIFNRYCAQCHGSKGAGTDKGPPLIHPIYHPNHHPDITFYMAAEKGVRAHHWGFGNMPRIEGVRREDVTMILSYIRQLQKEAGIF